MGKRERESIIHFSLHYQLWGLPLRSLALTNYRSKYEKGAVSFFQGDVAALMSSATAKGAGLTTTPTLSSGSWTSGWTQRTLWCSWQRQEARATLLPHCRSCGRTRATARCRSCHPCPWKNPVRATAQLLARAAWSLMPIPRKWAVCVPTGESWIIWMTLTQSVLMVSLANLTL